MGFLKLLKGWKQSNGFSIDNHQIVAMADGDIIDVKTVSDPVFAQEMLGQTIAFHFPEKKVQICSPANGKLEVLFPTGHAFGVTMKNGVELLVHIGVDTVNEQGKGFKLLGKKQGDNVKAGDPIIEVDFQQLSLSYDMSTMLIITNPNNHTIQLIEPCTVAKGDSLLSE